MRGTAFCPAHVTGLFKAEIGRGRPEEEGSLGAGFSIRAGVTTRVRAEYSGEDSWRVSTSGHGTDGTAVSERVISEFLGEAGGRRLRVEAEHEIGVPVGYGLGCSGAVALSLAMALNQALGAGLPPERVGQMAHRAEVACRTGLGDVIAAYHGGFEVRTAAGAPGVGRVEKFESDAAAVIACFAPVSTRDFMGSRMASINGVGGAMVERLARTGDHGEFQDMSLEFARHAGVMTPRMEAAAAALRAAGIRCGVAMFGETVFALVRRGGEAAAARVLGRQAGGAVITSRVDNEGARLQ